MRLSTLCIVGLSAPVLAYAFLPQSLRSPTQQALRSPQRIKNDVEVKTPWSQDDCSFTQLNMAFDSDKPSNMFDGPMALTKERDACGVGFIANTKSGGTNMRFYDST
jgi:glutamate synthase (ferredoxin)